MPLSRPPAPAALLALLVLSAGAGSAEPVSEAGPCHVSRGSLAFVGCSLAQKLLPAAAGAKVTVVDLKSDRELPAPDALRERVRSAVAAALRSSSSGPSAADNGKLRVELSLQKSAGVLRVTAELRRATGLWQRVRHKKPSAEQQAFVEVALDAELRALIPPPPLVVSETLKLKAPERGIVALACGPLGSDGGQELALVSRANVRVGRIAGRTFSERKRTAWAALSPVASAPLREPIAVAEITAGGTLRVGLSDRQQSLELTRELAVVARFEGALPGPNGACWPRTALGFSGLGPCVAKEAVTAQASPTLDALAGTASLWLGRDSANGSLIEAERGLVPNEARVGAQLALGDADSDGRPELAFSGDTLDAAKDRLTLVTLVGAKLTPHFTLAAPAIGAIAICSLREGPGMAPIVVATGDELWLIR